MLLLNPALLLILVLGLAVCQGGGDRKPPAPPPREVEVLTLAPSKVRETSEYLGTLVSRHSVSVRPQVAGYVRKILVRPGQKVEAGAALLEVDARQEAASLEGVQAQRRSAETNLALARQTLARTQSMYQEGLASAQELEGARAAAEAAEAATRSAGAAVSQGQVRLQYYAVRAPFAGTVGDVLVRLGDNVAQTTVLTSVAQADVLEVGVAVPADRARTISNETPVEILDEDGKVLVTSTVFFIAPQADPRTQLVEVKAVFRNNVGLRPSELLRTRLVYGEREALQVPALSVVYQSGQAFVFAVSQRNGGTTVERRPVTLGPLGEEAYVVDKGLAAGDRIAVSSLQALRDGAPIKVRGASAGHASGR
jgi:RND family efflux transporter MFP subunit